jgi:hypothetical protein
MRGEVDQSTVYKINNILPADIQTGFYTTSNAHKGTFFVTSGCNNVPIMLGLPQTFHYSGKAIAEDRNLIQIGQAFTNFAPCR